MKIIDTAVNWFNNIYYERADYWTYDWLDQNQVPGQSANEVLENGKVYVQITLKSMRVVNVRKGLDKFYGVVQSFIKVPHQGGKPAQFNTIVAPDRLKDVDSKNINNVITMNKILLGPVPYYDGIDAQIGLFSVRSHNLTERFVTLLDKMSELSGVSFVTAALPYAEPLKQGISLLTQSEGDSTVLEIGLSQTFQNLSSGWFYVMRASDKDFDKVGLKVREEDYILLDSNNNPIEDYPYMVFQVSLIKNKIKYFEIPEISDVFNNLRDEIRSGRYDKVEEALQAFKVIVQTSYDLTQTDKKRIVDEVEKQTKELLPATLVSIQKGETPKTLPLLRHLGIY